MNITNLLIKTKQTTKQTQKQSKYKKQTTMENNQPSRLRGPPCLARQTMSDEDIDVSDAGMEATLNILAGDVAHTPALTPMVTTARSATA
jgi:hypothetical protein